MNWHYPIWMIEEQRVFLSQQEILNSPSIQSGMSDTEEFTYRCFACELVREGQILLGLYYVHTTIDLIDHLLLVLQVKHYVIDSTIFIHSNSFIPSLVRITGFV